jgi:Uncharacterised nucleotidyltransferase
MTSRIESTPQQAGAPHEWLSTHALRALAEAKVPVLVGGAFAFTHYTGIIRNTKDLDLFVRAADLDAALSALRTAGFETTVPFTHWLAKARLESLSMDIIFASGNGTGGADDEWFQYARDSRLYGEPIRLMPPEEMLCSKALIMERERFDGADVAHLIHAQGKTLDWDRIVRRFGEHLPVLFVHVWLFLYIYSDGRERLPEGLLEDLHRLSLPHLGAASELPICRGTLLSREQFLVDVAMRGYADARLVEGTMTPEQIQVWTDAIGTPHDQ